MCGMNSLQWFFVRCSYYCILEERKLRLRGVTSIIQGHRAGKWQRWDLNHRCMLILDNERAVRTDAADLGPETLVLADGAELFLECLFISAPRPASARDLTGRGEDALGERTWKEKNARSRRERESGPFAGNISWRLLRRKKKWLDLIYIYIWKQHCWGKCFLRRLIFTLLATLVVSSLFSVPHKWGLSLFLPHRIVKNPSVMPGTTGCTLFSPSPGFISKYPLPTFALATASWPVITHQNMDFLGRISSAQPPKFICNVGFPCHKAQAAQQNLEPRFPALKSASSEDCVPMVACKCLFQEGNCFEVTISLTFTIIICLMSCVKLITA